MLLVAVLAPKNHNTLHEGHPVDLQRAQAAGACGEQERKGRLTSHTRARAQHGLDLNQFTRGNARFSLSGSLQDVCNATRALFYCCLVLHLHTHAKCPKASVLLRVIGSALSTELSSCTYARHRPKQPTTWYWETLPHTQTDRTLVSRAYRRLQQQQPRGPAARDRLWERKHEATVTGSLLCDHDCVNARNDEMDATTNTQHLASFWGGGGEYPATEQRDSLGTSCGRRRRCR